MRKHAKLRAAVIGCGAISDIYLTNLKTRFSTVEVVCCCALHPEHAAAKAAQYGIESRTYQQILTDDSIQLILLLTPASTHYALIREALLAGKHVYTEKTMSTSLAEAEELLALARRNGLLSRLRAGYVPRRSAAGRAPRNRQRRDRSGHGLLRLREPESGRAGKQISVPASAGRRDLL